jgi:NADH dehydrogenase/NADH:ubiquinone oxidoreductase subunit G
MWSGAFAESEAARNQYLAALNHLVPTLQAAIQGEFADVKTYDDLQRLMDEDPARYNRYAIAQAKLADAQRHQNYAQAEAAQRQRESFIQWQDDEAKKLGDLIPDLKDKAKAPKVIEGIRSFAAELGYTQEQMALASARDWATLHDAMQFRSQKNAEAEKAKAAAKELEEARKKAATAPPVQKPGVTQQTNTKDERVKERLQRFQKSGRPDDLATLLQESGLA